MFIFIYFYLFLLTGDFKDLCWQNHQWLLKVQAILFISCIFNSVSKDSFIVKALVYQSSLTCLRRITFHPPSSIQFSLPPDCHLMICNDCGLAAGSCRIQNILSLSNNGNIIHWWPVEAPSAVTFAILRWDCLDSLKLEVEQCPIYLPPPPHLFVIDKSCWTVWTFNCVLGCCWLELQMEVKRRFTKVSQSRRRPLL